MIYAIVTESARAAILRRRDFFSIEGPCFSSVRTTAVEPTLDSASFCITMPFSGGGFSTSLWKKVRSIHIMSGFTIYAITIPQIRGAETLPIHENPLLNESNLNTNTTNRTASIMTMSE